MPKLINEIKFETSAPLEVQKNYDQLDVLGTFDGPNALYIDPELCNECTCTDDDYGTCQVCFGASAGVSDGVYALINEEKKYEDERGSYVDKIKSIDWQRDPVSWYIE